MSAITNTHLKLHGMDRETFVKQFPNQPMVSEELSAKRSKLGNERYKNNPELAKQSSEFFKKLWRDNPELNQQRINKGTATKHAHPEIAKEAGKKISKLWKDEPWRLEKMAENWKKTIQADPTIQIKRAAKLKATLNANNKAIIWQAQAKRDPKKKEMARKQALTYAKNVANGKNTRLTKPHRMLIAAMKEANILGFKSERYAADGICGDEVNYGDWIVIEVYGNYWHCNPLTYKGDFYHTKRKMTAEQIWEYDRVRIARLESYGWKTIIVWEKDILSDMASCIQKIKEVCDEKAS